MCSKTYDVNEDHKDYKKIQDQQKELPTFICDLCNYKIQHEAEEKHKPKKPQSS